MDLSDEEANLANRDRLGDSRFKTKRTLLHEKKSEVFPKINKAILIKRGAENLLQVSNKNSMRHKVEEEADGQASELRLLKEKLDTYNSSFSIYQSIDSRLPMIPIGLKETRPIDFEKVLSHFISTHYHLDPASFSDAFQTMTSSREKVRTPLRSRDGLKAFRNYYVLLNTVERRFFDESVKHPFRFSWTDAFTGEEHNQRSPAFEKGALIFNYAALCSQIGVNYNPDSGAILEKQIEMFLQARSNLQVLQESFAHAPSKDMGPDILNFLVRIMTVQTQECVFTSQILDSASESEFQQLAKYIGGACLLSEQYGKIGSPCGSPSIPEDWSTVISVVPPSWINLLEIKSKFFQAQAYYQLAAVTLNLAINGSTRLNLDGNQDLGQPLFVDGDNPLLESRVSENLGQLFSTLHPFLKLNPKNSSTKNKSKGLRRHKSFTKGADKETRSSSRIRRPFSSLSFSSWGRSKSQPGGLNECSGRMSAMSGKSNFSKYSSASIQSFVQNGSEITPEVAPPDSRKDAFLFGQTCLTEALTWIQQALLIVHSAEDLRREQDLNNYVSDLVKNWTKQLDLVKQMTRGPVKDGNTGGPTPRPRHHWLGRSKSQNKGGSPVSSSVPSVSSLQTTSQSHVIHSVKESSQNPWNAPTFLPDVLELPKDNSRTLKAGFLKESQDPFRLLGTQKYFNAKKWWSPSYSAHLVRDELVGYGFSIQGDGPVEILGVDPDTPASDNGLMTSDLIVGINGLDARFMLHGDAVHAIRFGSLQKQEGDDDDALLNEVDVVDLELIRPISPPLHVQPKPLADSGPTPNSGVSTSRAGGKVIKHSSMCSTSPAPHKKYSTGSTSSAVFQIDEWFFSKPRNYSSSNSLRKDTPANKLKYSPYT